jgi:hypothetical protein
MPLADWTNQTIRLIGRTRHFGGLQWYFVCPVQNRIVSALWSLPGTRYFVGRKVIRQTGSIFIASSARPEKNL